MNSQGNVGFGRSYPGGRMRSFCFALLLAVLGLAPVSAEEFRWDGFYAGGSAGWGDGAVSWTDQNAFGWFVPSPFQSLEESGSGFIGGIHVGAMKQWENGIVTGVELSVERPDIDMSTPIPGHADTISYMNLELLVSSALRIGYSRDRHLYYLKFGVSAGNVKLKNEYRRPNFFELVSTQAWHPGFVAGLGFEKSLTRNLFFGAEYNFVKLASRIQSGPMESSGVTFGDWEYYDVGAELHTVKLRIGYFFN